MPKYTEQQLQEAIKHAQREPDVPTQRIAELYRVDRMTLRRRVLGTHKNRAVAHRHKQLFSTGEEKAIADYAGLMADAGFPLNPDLLRQIAQGIINERQIPQQGQGGGIVGCQESTNTRDKRKYRLERQGAIPPPSTNDPSTSNLPIHFIGVHWVDRFLNRNPGFKKVYIRYQERQRAAATNDIELQADFLRKLANLIRQKKIAQADIWNCDEKGITMGKHSKRIMAIVRVGGKSTAMTEGSREFCSVLETISAEGVVIPPFIVWQGKTHRESYYREGGVEYEATFAVSPSGYMDDELGLEYMKQHFEPYTRGDTGPGQPRCLIVDGHSSHVAWQVVKYALDHNIHPICLPSKSTHLLQPLDVGCFSLLQTTYKRNLSTWLRKNPLLGVSKIEFLDILQQTRKQVFTTEIIQSAWKAARCWPIERWQQPSTTAGSATASSATASSAVTSSSRARAVLDTPARFRKLSRELEEIAGELSNDQQGKIIEFIDFAMEKVTGYRDIAPCAETLKRLRDGKVRKEKQSRRHVGEARVLGHKYVNERLKKLAEDEALKLAKQKRAERRKRIAEEKNAMRGALDTEWRIDLQ